MAKILTVEDEALVLLLIAETLSDAGHSVFEATNGEEALQILEANPDIELIVTDVRMAKMDGFSLAAAARKRKPDLPMIFMTGYMGSDVPARIPGARVLQKPFDPNDLLVAIDQALGRRAP